MNYTTILINTIIHIILVLIFEGVFLFVILYKTLALRVSNNTDYFTWYFQSHFVWPTINWSNCVTPNTNPKDITPYFITPEEYKIIQIGEQNEEDYINSNSNYPYTVYAILMTILIILLIIIIFISRNMNIYVNYKYIIINSVIIFLLICGLASTVLWFDVFSLKYKINIAKPFLEKFLEEYKSL